jgi:hypothetical protein
MAVVFALPVVAGWFLYLNPDLLPTARVNRGELIDPARPWPDDLGLVRPDGAPFARDGLAGKWTLLLAARAPCDAGCVARLVDLRQIRLAAGEGGLAVERLLILAGSADAAVPAESLAGAGIARLAAVGEQRLVAWLGPRGDIWNRVYTVDPLGNLMMRYAADAPARDVLKDTERLLKASRNWIKGEGYGHR